MTDPYHEVMALVAGAISEGLIPGIDTDQFNESLALLKDDHNAVEDYLQELFDLV